MCRSVTSGRPRRCASCTSYPAAARANGNRRMGRLARRAVAEHLQARDLTETAAAVMSSPPSMLAAVMAAVGVDDAVLNGVPTPAAAAAAAAAPLVAVATEEAGRLARRKVADHLKARGLTETAAAVMSSPPSALGEVIAAMRVDEAVLDGLPKPPAPAASVPEASVVVYTARTEVAKLRRGAAAPHQRRRPAANVPNCKSNISVIEKWEIQAESVFAADSTKARCRSARAEAEMLCKGCPLLEGCARNAQTTQYTGVAGGRIFVNGRHRLTPSSPARIVAA